MMAGWRVNSPYESDAMGGGGAGNLYGVASRQQQQLFVTVSQGLQWKKGLFAHPVLGGLPAGVTSANAYTLNLPAADEDRTLTKRQRKRGTVNAGLERPKGGTEEDRKGRK